MADYDFFQIDAFASQTFEGNQACVMPMDAFLANEILQAIAAENNVAETAFIVPVSGNRWQLRWFTPTMEVPLCGHATLASAHVLFQHKGFESAEIIFETRKSGELVVTRSEHGYVMDFPAQHVAPTDVSEALIAALGARPVAAFSGPFLTAIFETSDQIKALTPDLKAVAGLRTNLDEERGNVGCFALDGEGVDVTSRFFAPGSGIDEDPATGSWHCVLASVVAQYTGQVELSCFQAYPGRGARIATRFEGERVKLAGEAVTVIEGVFRL